MAFDDRIDWREVYPRDRPARSTKDDRLNRKVIEAAKTNKVKAARNRLVAEFEAELKAARQLWMLDDEPHQAQKLFERFLHRRGIEPFALECCEDEYDTKR